MVAKNCEKTNPQDSAKEIESQAEKAVIQGDWKIAAKHYADGLAQRTAELALINSVQAGLSEKLEMQGIYDLVGDKLRDTFNAQIVMISQYDPNTNKIYHHYAIERGQHLNIQGWRAIDSSRAEIVRTRKPFMINGDEILKVLSAGMMKVVPGTDVPRTWLGVPMLLGNQVRGIVSLQNLDKEHAFVQSDIDLLMTLTTSMTLSLENARLFNETERLLNLLEGEMEIARRTQRSILPNRLPHHTGYDLGAMIVPARAVGGDFYDVIPLGKDQLCLVVGDVSDKGLPAALFMALTFSLIRTEAARVADPKQVLLNVNQYLLKMNTAEMFVTLICGILDYTTGVLIYARAGHLVPVILNQSGRQVSTAMDTGQPLGLFKEPKIDQQEVTIPHGGLALLCSDGVTEAMDAEGREFGFDRIKKELSVYRGQKAQMICKQLWNAVEAYSGDMPHQDDFTALIVKRL